MEEEYKPKLSITEIVFITPFYLISDALDWLVFLFGLDDIGMISLVRTSVSEFYFIVIKKMGPEIWATNLVAGAITAIPYVGQLLPSTLTWAVIVIMDHFGMAKLKGIVDKAGAVGKVVKAVGEKVAK